MLSMMLPRICICCGLISDQGGICDNCTIYLPWLEDRCYQCGGNIADSSIICLRCKNSPPPYDRVCALFSYEKPLTRIIHRIKFGGKASYANLLGSLLAKKLKDKWYVRDQMPQVIIPVPLYSMRQRKRGYNQATEIGKAIARKLDIAIDISSCKRIRSTSPQARLNKDQRHHNLQNAFSADIDIKYVALLDDVVTTGSTIKAVSEVLKKSGVENIDVWCICRG